MANLYFRYGAMNCGKTSRLISEIYNYEVNRNMKVLLIKSKKDTKGNDYVVSRTGFKRKVDILLRDNDDINIKSKIDAIFVDEAQFLSKKNIRDLWKIAKEKNIPVLCYGLRTDFQLNLFEGSRELLALADKLEELPTICKCGHKARFNIRYNNGKLVTEGNSISIDGVDGDTYDSVCGNCYLEIINNEK